MLAFWYTKGDREQAVYHGQNRYARDAPLSEANFASWLGVVEDLLKPGDVVVICEGNEWVNKQILLNKLAATKWTVRPVVLEFDSEGWRSLWASGTPMKNGKRATPRVPRGFAKAGAAETMYICWQGKQPRVAKAWEILNGNQATTNNVLKGIPVVTPAQLSLVDEAVRQAVHAGSIVAASEPVESGSGSSGEEKGGSRKYTKRGRAARRTATDTQNSLLFANAPAPKFVQALAKTFQVDWIFNGTPESGVAAAACVEIGVQTVALCKNDAHSSCIQGLVLAEVRRLLLDGGSAICNIQLAPLHVDLQEEEESSSCSDGSSASGSETDEGHKAKKAKKEVQAKKAKKEVREKKAKQAKKEGQEKKAKKEKNEKMEKKEKKEGADVAMASSDAVADWLTAR